MMEHVDFWSLSRVSKVLTRVLRRCLASKAIQEPFPSKQKVALHATTGVLAKLSQLEGQKTLEKQETSNFVNLFLHFTDP